MGARKLSALFFDIGSSIENCIKLKHNFNAKTNPDCKTVFNAWACC